LTSGVGVGQIKGSLALVMNVLAKLLEYLMEIIDNFAGQAEDKGRQCSTSTIIHTFALLLMLQKPMPAAFIG